MAKYEVIFSCGHKGTVELFGKEKERQNKIEYFKKSGTCRDCYKKQIEENNQKMGLIFNADVLPYLDDTDGSMLLVVWFSGYTKPYKDKIKELGGYIWDYNDYTDKSNNNYRCWHKIIKRQDFDKESKNAISIGANVDMIPTEIDILASEYHCTAYRLQTKWKNIHNKIALLEKPHIPKLLIGHKWNQKIYGKAGGYSIYLDGNKTFITDDQKLEIQNYLNKKEEYEKKVEEIKNA